jgi:hypothetical protein
MTLDAIMRDIEAMREDLMTFERKYNVPTEVFYQAYQQGEEPPEQAWVLDWGDWAGAYELLQESLKQYDEVVQQLIDDATVENVSQLMERTARHEPVAIPG